MKIVCIHGMNQQHYTRATLTQHWYALLNKGFAQINCDLPKLHLDVAYYADVLIQYHQQNRLQLGNFHFMPKHALDSAQQAIGTPPTLSPTVSTLSASLDAATPSTFAFNQASPLRPMVNSMNSAYSRKQGESHHDWRQRLSEMEYSIKNHLLKDIVTLLDHFPLLHIRLVHEFLMETYLYISQDSFMQDVHQRLLPLFDRSERHIVIAHSLGSVIAYNFLRRHPEFQIEHLITLASPLSFQIIQQHLTQPICRPESLVGDWYNVYSEEDFLTIHALDQPPFNFARPIINQKIHSNIQNPHQLAEYLASNDVMQYLFRCITSSS